MKDLIERLEKATGPDRDLDVAIAIATGWERRTHVGSDYTWRDPVSLGWELCPWWFTSNLNAAVRLVPEGYWWSCGYCRRECHASVGIDPTPEESATLESEHLEDGFGATVAIALCVAALKARLAISAQP